MIHSNVQKVKFFSTPTKTDETMKKFWYGRCRTCRTRCVVPVSSNYYSLSLYIIHIFTYLHIFSECISCYTKLYRSITVKIKVIWLYANIPNETMLKFYYIYCSETKVLTIVVVHTYVRMKQ